MPYYIPEDFPDKTVKIRFLTGIILICIGLSIILIWVIVFFILDKSKKKPLKNEINKFSEENQEYIFVNLKKIIKLYF